MKDVASLIESISSLLWPLLVLLIVLMFRKEIRDAAGQFRCIRRGKFLGQEIEFDEDLAQDESSRILNSYLFPNGAYSHERLQTLNSLLVELGFARDVRLIVDGADGVVLRKQLIKYARDKGFALDASPVTQILP